MAYKSLSQFIGVLEEAGELTRVSKAVSPDLEMSEVVDRLVKNGGKAVLFENSGTAFPVLMNAMGSEKRMCMALGVNDLDEVGQLIASLFATMSVPRAGLWEKLRLLPSLARMSSWFPALKHGRGECQQVVMDNPDLNRLPILTCWPHDGGRFITLPGVHTKDPSSGGRNLGMYRMQVYDGQTTGMHWHLHKNSARHYHAYKALGRRMPVTVTLGGDPVYTYAATAPMPDNVDEYLLAGFLRGKKVELVKCLTNDLEVPADVDFVIEGYVDTAEPLRVEGPFGDHTGFYSLPDNYPVFHVTCITHRRDAVYPATIVGIPPQEDLYLGLATERIFIQPIRVTILPELADMHMPAEGVFHNLVLTRIAQSYPGQGAKVMNALWGAGQMMLNKVMVVFGMQADPGGTIPALKDYARLLDSYMPGFEPARDVYFSKGPVDVLDHASDAFAFGGKMGIDLSHCSPDASTVPGSGLSYIRIIPLAKNRPLQVRQEVDRLKTEGVLEELKLLVFTEEFMHGEDFSSITWRVLNNIDPARDCFIVPSHAGGGASSTLVIDGTRKYSHLDGFTRPWPNCTVSDQASIDTINRLWETLGLGPFLPSPSEKYRHMLYPGEAAAR